MTMKEVQKTVILLLKHNLLKERKKRLVLKLSSSRDVDQLQVELLTKSLTLHKNEKLIAK